MKVGSLFSGCLGLDIGLEAAGFETAWVCENDDACQNVIRHHRPDLPIYPDVRELDGSVPHVDVLAGGFPCQDLSYAGRGKGLEGDRSGLWFAYADAIRVLRPRLVIVENVPGLATRGLGRVLYDLAEAGYVGHWLRLRAADVGAPHGRERIFILAADAERLRIDADERVRGGSAGAPGRPVQASVPAGTEVAQPADAVADGAGAASDAGSERSHRRGGGNAGRETGGGGDGRSVAEGSAEDAANAYRPGPQGAQPERRRFVSPRSGESVADADGESGQSWVGRGVEGGDNARPWTEERDGDGLDGKAEHGPSGEAVSDADESGVEAWGDERRDGERARLQPVGSSASARRRGETAADTAGGGRSRGKDGTRGDEERRETSVGGESDAAVADGDRVAWGTYEPAVRQWERIFGRPAPRPTDDRGRLSPEFVEWMMGFPDGWTSVVSRTSRLRMLGNAVQVQCGTVVGMMLREMVGEWN